MESAISSAVREQWLNGTATHSMSFVGLEWLRYDAFQPTAGRSETVPALQENGHPVCFVEGAEGSMSVSLVLRRDVSAAGFHGASILLTETVIP